MKFYLRVVDFFFKFIFVSDQLIPQFFEPQSKHVNKIDTRHIEGNFTYPSETTPISTRYLLKVASNPNNLMREEIEQRSHHLSDRIQITQCQITASCTTQNTLIIHLHQSITNAFKF